MSTNRTPAISFILITVLIDVIGFGIIIPVLPKLIMELTGGGIAEAARYGGWLMFSYAMMQFVFAPITGGLSDRFGRRPVLLISLFGFGIDYIFLALAPTIGWLFLGRIVAGIFGSSITTATAYIADITSQEKRAQNFGLIGAAFGLGFIIGPFLGGILGQYGSRIPFYAAAGLALLNWLYGYFILPESLPKEKRRAFEWKRANPLGSFKQLKKSPIIMGLALCLTFVFLSGQATHSTWAYYTMEKFGWDEKWVGYSLAFVGLMVAIVQGGLIRIVIPKIGEIKAVYFGLSLYFIGFLLFAFATQGWMMFAFMVPYALGGFAGPSLRSIISNQVSEKEQGEIQGALTSLVSITSVISPPVMTGLFAYYTDAKHVIYFPGAPFMLGAILILVAITFAVKTFSQHKI